MSLQLPTQIVARHKAELAAKNAEIKTLNERLAIASRRVAMLLGSSPTGIPAVDKHFAELCRLPSANPYLDRGCRSMKLPT